MSFDLSNGLHTDLQYVVCRMPPFGPPTAAGDQALNRTQHVQSDGKLIPIWMVNGRGTFSAAPVQRQPSTRPGHHRRVLIQTERHLFILDLVV